MRKYTPIRLIFVNGTQFTHQHPYGRIEPMKRHDKLHPHQVPCMKIAYMHPFVKQNDIPMKLIILLGKHNGAPPAKRNVLLRANYQSESLTFTNRTLPEQPPYPSQSTQEECQRKRQPAKIECHCNSHPLFPAKPCFLQRKGRHFAEHCLRLSTLLDFRACRLLRQPSFHCRHRTLPVSALLNLNMYAGQQQTKQRSGKQQNTIRTERSVAPETKPVHCIEHGQTKRRLKQVKQKRAHCFFTLYVCPQYVRLTPSIRPATYHFLPQM